MPSIRKSSVKKPSRLKINRKCASKASKKKPSRKNNLIRDDGFYTWTGFVARWREREAQRGSEWSFAEAMQKAKKPWEQYKERNGIVTNEPRKKLVPKGANTWPEFIKQWAEDEEVSFHNALSNPRAKKDWEQHKVDHR